VAVVDEQVAVAGRQCVEGSGFGLGSILSGGNV
jgi:hypothetical protein